MGMFDSFRTEFEGSEHLAQTKAFACMLANYRIGDDVVGNSRAVHQGASAHIEETYGKGVPPWVILLLHDGIYVDYGWAASEEEAGRVAQEMITNRLGSVLPSPEVWKSTLARVVEERGQFIDIVGRASRLLSNYESFQNDQVRYEKQRGEPIGALLKLPDFQERGFLQRLEEVLGGNSEGGGESEEG